MSSGKGPRHVDDVVEPRATPGVPHTLPLRTHPLIGRERDLDAAGALFARDAVRLITITGAPGVGKTRFAIELAAAAASEFDDGVAFVDLAPLRDPGLVMDGIARTLGLVEHPDRPPLQRLQRHLDDRHTLLLLDNFEHVIAAAANVADLLAACQHVKVLVTSRQPLHVRWEHRYSLSPLALPARDRRPNRDGLVRFPATRLFIERAREADVGLVIDESSAAAIAEICRRMDGLPLAIELAAAWVGTLGPQAILSRLSQREFLPSHGPHDAPERQRTLVAAVAWSYDLLSAPGRAVFRALGAAAGETPLEAIEATCEGLGVDILTPVAELVDKSLLVRVAHGETGFRMLETVRGVAEERLDSAGEGDTVRRRHAAWCLSLARQAERFIWSEHQTVWLERIERIHDNIRAALNWCMSDHDEETGVLLAAAMHRFWFARGYMREGRRWCELAASKQRVSVKARALALRNLAFFLTHQGEVERALPLAEQATTLARTVDEPSLMAWVLHGLAQAVAASGNGERSEQVYGEMLDVARRAGDNALAARALCGIAAELLARSDTVQARALLEEALALARPRHDKWLSSVVTANLAMALTRDDPDQALRFLEESLALSHDIGHRWQIVRRIEDLARMLAESDRAHVSAKLLGASEGFREAFDFARGPSVRALVDAARVAASQRLGAAVFEAAYAAGRTMTIDEAVSLVLKRGHPTRVERPSRPGGLTSREVQIALDITRGLTNRQIAERLQLSERTVDAHVQNMRNKLGVERRAQIAAWASTHLTRNAPA